MNELPKRKQIRLKEFDYSSANYYHVTICTANKASLFGIGENLTDYGKAVKNQILKLPMHYKNISVDKYVIMPNHIHMIIVIAEGAASGNNVNPTLGTVVGAFKSGVSREIHTINPTVKVWQQRFYDHVIKDAADYENVWTYIDENPIKWESDEYC